MKEWWKPGIWACGFYPRISEEIGYLERKEKEPQLKGLIFLYKMVVFNLVNSQLNKIKQICQFNLVGKKYCLKDSQKLIWA